MSMRTCSFGPEARIELKATGIINIHGFYVNLGKFMQHRGNLCKFIQARGKFRESFEPYFVVPSWLWARYNEDLMERMCDKAAYTRLLHGLGFEFWVASDDFILLLLHPLSDVTKKYFIYQDMQRFFFICIIKRCHYILSFENIN
ncbi:hypothetical protein HELRODRAFT_172691 [Helobdella robusta]|uniref:Uncharacterized protein n=1 Tax=Helobdella robusta TaxID=6412 RepID=T1F5S8_HELRO|nr:hypothetical protein HELRODRAFT_172691 [Helobdella robusta]ESO04330.1 hypothetical protein HELRODRAFT_172691 [Helobdella robusta]